MENFDRKSQKHIQTILESGEEFVFEGTKDFRTFKVKNNKVVADGVDENGRKIEVQKDGGQEKVQAKAYMLLKDKNGLQYLMRHTLAYEPTEDRYSSICRCYDLMNDSELDRLEMLCKRYGVEPPRAEPVAIMHKGKEVKDCGCLWLVMSHNTYTFHRARKLPVSSDLTSPYKGVDLDVYLSMFSTFSHSYDRGIGKNTMHRVEEIAAILHEGMPRIKFVGGMVPLDFNQKYKKKLGEPHKELIDEYGMRRIDDCYCAIASIYEKLGFKVTTISCENGHANTDLFSKQIRATVLSKELRPAEILRFSTTPKHFLNPLLYEDYDEM